MISRHSMHSAPGLAAAVAFFIAACGAHADWRDGFKVLRIGVVTGANADYRQAQLEPLRTYFEARSSLPVEIVALPDYAALIEAQIGSRVHYAIYSATAYATASARCDCVEPLAAPTAANGETGFHALLVARADGPIRSLADAEGKRLALSAPDSVAGRLIQLQALTEQGLSPPDYFSDIVELADPEMTVTALLAGDADLAAAWSSLSGDAAEGYSFGVLASLVADGGLSMEQIRIVWQSERIPFGPHAVRSDMPEELKALLSRSLLDMAAEDPAALDAVDRSGGRGFAAVDDAAYAPVAALVATAPAQQQSPP